MHYIPKKTINFFQTTQQHNPKGTIFCGGNIFHGERQELLRKSAQ
jgi:hypothetical protein